MKLHLKVTLLIFAALVFSFPQMVQAATIPYPITSGIPVKSILRGETFFTTNFSINYNTGQIFLSLNPNGTGNTVVDDAIEIIATRPNEQHKVSVIPMQEVVQVYLPNHPGM